MSLLKNVTDIRHMTEELERSAQRIQTADEEIRGPFLLARSIFASPAALELSAGTAAEVPVQRVIQALSGADSELEALPPGDQVLHIDLKGRDPDDAMTAVPYEKGAAFLHRLEQVYGRRRFDAFLAGYFDAYAFSSITTADFLRYLDQHLLAATGESAR